MHTVIIFITLHSFSREIYLNKQPTSFFKIMLNLVILAHHVCVSNVNSIVLVDLPIIQLGVELVRRGVK